MHPTNLVFQVWTGDHNAQLKLARVRRQNLLDTKWPELRETLAHQVVL